MNRITFLAAFLFSSLATHSNHLIQYTYSFQYLCLLGLFRDLSWLCQSVSDFLFHHCLLLLKWNAFSMHQRIFLSSLLSNEEVQASKTLLLMLIYFYFHELSSLNLQNVWSLHARYHFLSEFLRAACELPMILLYSLFLHKVSKIYLQIQLLEHNLLVFHIFYLFFSNILLLSLCFLPFWKHLNIFGKIIKIYQSHFDLEIKLLLFSILLLALY